MNVKIALLTLLVILAATTIVVTTVAAFTEAPSTKNIKRNLDEGIFDHATLSGEVQPLSGDPKDGGWP